MTSNLGDLKKPTLKAIQHGLNRYYYSLTIDYKIHELEHKVCFQLSFQVYACFFPVISLLTA